MSGLGNRSFQGLGLHPDVARRLDDLSRNLSTVQSALSGLSPTPAPTVISAPARASSVLNVTNAVGQVAASANESFAYSLSINGTLAIQSDGAPLTKILQSFTPNILEARVKGAPATSPITAALLYYSPAGITTAVATFTIPAGAKSASASTAAVIPEGNYWRVDVLAVGSPTQPGSDLTVTVGYIVSQ